MNRILQTLVFTALVATTAMSGTSFSAPDTGLTRALASKPQSRQDPSDHYYRGVTLESTGSIDEAAREYRLVLQQSPAHGDARRRLAEICLLRGDPPGAIEQFRELARYQEKNPVIRNRLAQIYESNGSYRKATTEYREAVRLAPQSIPARRRLAILYEKRKLPNEATAEYRRILTIDRNDIFAQHALIALYLRGKRYEDLTDFLKEAVARKPDEPTGHYKLGLVYEFSKKYEGAEEEYGKAIKLNTAYAKAMNALARVYMKTNRIDEEKKLLEAASKADPNLKESTLLLHNINEEFKPVYAVRKNAKYGKNLKRKRKIVNRSKKRRCR